MAEVHMKKAFDVAAATIFLTMTAGYSMAHTAAIGPETVRISVRYQPEELTSPESARILLKRIGDAALESCGASSFSLNELKIATAHSTCWRNAVAEAVRRVDSPALSAVAVNDGR
jgi:UrcA family protein